MQIIGIDCASSPKSVGLACALRDQLGRVTLVDARLGTTQEENISLLVTWLDRCEQTLICIDAPLGWPKGLGEVLHTHLAGMALPALSANSLFRRETDKHIRERLGKQSLDVGADRIARTAYAALALLESLRLETQYEIPLAWAVPKASSFLPCAIEVYPAATLKALGSISSGYKRDENQPQRGEIITVIAQLLSLPDSLIPVIEDNADALDAVICCLAGADFMAALCIEPDDMSLAHYEGWMWVRRA